MAKYDVTAPDGTVFEVDAPDNATEQAVMSYAKQQFAAMGRRPREDAIDRSARESAKPTFGEDLAKQSLLTARYGLEGLGGGIIADKFGLPKPEGSTERIVGDVARTMAGTAALTGAAGQIAPKLQGVSKQIAELLASGPLGQIMSSAGAGAGGGLARESGAGPMGQMAAAIGGGLAVPVVGALAGSVGSHVADIGATVGATFGNKRGVERLARGAAQKAAGDSRLEQINMLQTAPTYVGGAGPTAAEAIAGQQIGRPSQVGGGTVRLERDLRGAVGIEDVLPSKLREQRGALDQYGQSVRAAAAPLREGALDAANFGRVKSQDVTNEITRFLNTPGTRASTVARRALTKVSDDIEALTNPYGVIDARDLYTIRKELGNTIGMFSKESNNWDKRLTGGLERDIQKSIDDAIVKAGGVDWPKYLQEFSKGMRNIEATELRQREAKLIAAGVKSQNPANLTSGESPKIPNLLNRTTAMINFGLRLVSKDAQTPVMRRLAEAMTDPQEYAKLLKLPPQSTTGEMARDIAKQALVSAIAYGQQPPQ